MSILHDVHWLEGSVSRFFFRKLILKEQNLNCNKFGLLSCIDLEAEIELIRRDSQINTMSAANEALIFDTYSRA